MNKQVWYMSDTSKKILWVCEMLVRENPRQYTAFSLAASCGWNQHDVDDALYDLVQRGLVRITSTSQLEAT